MQSLFIFVLHEIKAEGRKLHLFLGLFYKKAKICFYCEWTNKSNAFIIPIIFMAKSSCLHC